jgi:hypothetical protein
MLVRRMGRLLFYDTSQMRLGRDSLLHSRYKYVASNEALIVVK